MGLTATSYVLTCSLQLTVFLVVFSSEITLISAGSSNPSFGKNSSVGNETNKKCDLGGNECKEGVILPIWLPENPSFGNKLARATVYFVGLFYMFLGVSIIA
ncbi:hypothetical protein DPEC_G00178870, partial [Dallia pectoralis]